MPSNIPVPGYTSAVSGVGMFGLGMTHGRPVAAYGMSRRQPATSMTDSSASRPPTSASRNSPSK